MHSLKIALFSTQSKTSLNNATGVDPGERIGVTIEGVEGELHFSEGASVVVSWDTPQSCNYVELILSSSTMTKNELHSEVVRIARSLVEKD